MNAPRFHLPGPAPRDTQIIERATELKIDLWKDKDGDIHGGIAFHCGIGAFDPSGEKWVAPDEFARRQAATMDFIADALAAFNRKPDDREGAHHG
jgi:hypothetical protein